MQVERNGGLPNHGTKEAIELGCLCDLDKMDFACPLHWVGERVWTVLRHKLYGNGGIDE